MLSNTAPWQLSQPLQACSLRTQRVMCTINMWPASCLLVMSGAHMCDPRVPRLWACVGEHHDAGWRWCPAPVGCGTFASVRASHHNESNNAALLLLESVMFLGIQTNACHQAGQQLTRPPGCRYWPNFTHLPGMIGSCKSLDALVT